MKRMGIILIVLVLLLSGCNSKTEESEIVLIVDGEEITAEDLLDSIDKELDNGMFGLEELIATNEPIEFDTSGLSEDEYRIRSVFEGAMFTIEDPNNGEGLYTEDAFICNIYENNLVHIGGYNKQIGDFNSSLLAEEISDMSGIKLDYCYIPKQKSSVGLMMFGEIDNKKYIMLGGDIERNQNSNIDWKVVEANNGTSAKEVATLYAQMDNIKLESYYMDEKTIFFFSDGEGWFLSRYNGVEEFSTVYLWDYEHAICAVIVPGDKQENFDYCEFVKYDF